MTLSHFLLGMRTQCHNKWRIWQPQPTATNISSEIPKMPRPHLNVKSEKITSDFDFVFPLPVSSTNTKEEFECEHCHKSFKIKRYLTIHKITHLNQRNHVCSVCDKKFKQSHHLRDHMLSHSKEECCKCPYCDNGKEYSTTRYLIIHIRRVHHRKGNKDADYPPNPKNHEEEEDSDPLVDPLALDADADLKPVFSESASVEVEVEKNNKSELVVASSEFPTLPTGQKCKVLCKICHKSYTRNTRLNRHIAKTHPGNREIRIYKFRHVNSNPKVVNKQFICEHCGKVYKRKDALNKHQLVHKGEKNHGCEVCGKRFYVKDKLDRHKISHVNNCTKCHQSFKSKKNLNIHMATHSE